MKKIIFALLLLVLLASCGTKSKETTSTSKDSSIPYTSSSSPSSSLSQSIEKKTEYPASLSNFSNGDYSNFNCLHKSTAIVISLLVLTKSVITPLNKKQLGQSSQIKVLINLKQNLLHKANKLFSITEFTSFFCYNYKYE